MTRPGQGRKSFLLSMRSGVRIALAAAALLFGAVRASAQGYIGLYGSTLPYPVQYPSIFTSSTTLPLNVKDFGAVCNGTGDDSGAIQAAINAAGALPFGGEVFIPGVCAIAHKLVIRANNIRLQGVNGFYSATALKPISEITGPTLNDTILSIGTVDGVVVDNVGFSGGGIGAPNSVGIAMTGNGGHSPFFSHLFFDQFSGPAVELGNPSGNFVVGGTLEYCFAQNSLLGRPASDFGVFDVNVSDLVAIDNFATASVANTGGLIGNGHSWAWVVRGTNGLMLGNMAELSQQGWLVTGSYVRFVGNRAFENQGLALKVTGSNNVVVDFMSLSNGITKNDTLDAVVVTGGGNTFTAVTADTAAGAQGHVVANVISDQAGGNNYYSGNSYVNIKTGLLNGVAGSIFDNGAYTGVGMAVGQPRRTNDGDHGDAGAVNINCDLNTELQLWNTPLSANRTANLSNNGAYGGCRFRVVRTAASTGASDTLKFTGVSPAGLFLLTGQWIEFEFQASSASWLEVAKGAL